jgi:hypothetical protein
MTQIFSILFVSLISFPFCKVFWRYRNITNAKSKIKSLEIDRDKAKRKLKSAQRSIQRLRQRIEQSKVQNLTPRKETENIMKEANYSILKVFGIHCSKFMSTKSGSLSEPRDASVLFNYLSRNYFM